MNRFGRMNCVNVMSRPIPPALLLIGFSHNWERPHALDATSASTAREAIATMRLITFDLIIVGLQNARINVWQLMGQVLTAWPQQRWILIADDLTVDEEVTARSLGPLLVLPTLPNETWFAEFTASFRQVDWLHDTPPQSLQQPYHRRGATPIETLAL